MWYLDRPRCLHFPNLHCTAETPGWTISVFRVSCSCWHTRVFGQVLLESFFILFLFHNPVTRIQRFEFCMSLMLLGHVHQNPRTPRLPAGAAEGSSRGRRRGRRKSIPEAGGMSLTPQETADRLHRGIRSRTHMPIMLTQPLRFQFSIQSPVHMRPRFSWLCSCNKLDLQLATRA